VTEDVKKHVANLLGAPDTAADISHFWENSQAKRLNLFRGAADSLVEAAVN